MIPYGRQSISEEDVEAVVAVLRSPFLTQGPAVPLFEAALAERLAAPSVVAMNSATSALHAVCLALGLGPGDRLWTSPNTFLASANVALYCGAQPDFVDIDESTYLLDLDKLELKLKAAEKAGRLPKILIPVHFAGRSAPMRPIAALGLRYGFKIVEDAAHALGALYEGRPVGDCRYAEAAVFSFHPVKIATTGEGGAVSLRSEALRRRLERIRSHGMERDPGRMSAPPDGPWSYEQVELGYNYRLTDLQAALGLSQLRRLDGFLERRRRLADRYDALLADVERLDRPSRSKDAASSWHLYVVRLAEGLDRKRVFEAMRAAGVGVQVHYAPVHTQPVYRTLGFRPGDFPAAETYYARALTLPLYPDLTEADQDFVVDRLKAALEV